MSQVPATKLSFEESLKKVVADDVEGLIEAQKLYGDSWRAEGGFSAYFNIKRKIDRFINLLKRPPENFPTVEGVMIRERYDLFSNIRTDIFNGGEATLDAVRDLRRYLTLAEAWLVENGEELPVQRDNASATRRRTSYVPEINRAN